MGQGSWKLEALPATLVGTERLLWEAAGNNGLGKEPVNTVGAQSPSPTVQWMERERTRGRQNKRSKDSSGGLVHLLREPRGGRKGTSVARATTERLEKESVIGGKWEAGRREGAHLHFQS